MRHAERALAVGLLVLSATGATAQLDDLERLILPEAVVKDRFLGFFVGMVLGDVEVSLDVRTMNALFPELASMRDIPLDEMESFSRGSAPRGGSPMVTTLFKDSLRIPLPVDFFGYHPGWITMDRRMVARETALPAMSLGEVNGRSLVAAPVYLFRIEEGQMRFDIDWWLDALLGKRVSDLQPQVVLLLRVSGRWFALVGGTSHRNSFHQWTFDLRNSYFLARPPPQLATLTRRFVQVPDAAHQ